MGDVWQQIAGELPDFVTHGGDISYANECGAGAVHQYFNDIAPIATLRAYQQSWGNHEYGAPTSTAPPGTPRDSMANYKGRLYLANPQASSNDTAKQVSNPGCPSPSNPAVNGCQGSDWGYYTVGHVLIISYPEPWYTSQTDWGPRADALMAAAQADPAVSYIVTTGHRPAYSASTSQLDAPLKTVLDGLGDKYSPQARPGGKYVLNIAHHVHGGEVFAPQHGVVHVTNGGGGTADPTFGNAVAGSVFHLSHFEHLRMTVTDARLRIDMICGPVDSGRPPPDTCTMGSTVYTTTIPVPAAQPPPGPKQWVTNRGLDGGDRTGWTGVYHGLSKVGVSQDSTGNWRVQIGTTSATAQPAGVNNPAPFWVNNATTAAMTYTATAHAAANVAGKQAYVLVRETAPSGAGVGYAQSAPVTVPATGLVQLPSVNYKAVNSGDSIRFSLVATNLSAGQLLYADNFSLMSPS